MRLIQPDEIRTSVHHVDYGQLRRFGRRALLFDLENTLCLYRDWRFDDRTWALLRDLLAQAFRIAILSNAPLPEDSQFRGELASLGIPVFMRARKPLRGGFLRALEALGAKAEEAAMIGDQLLTDVLGAKRAGLYAILVDPLGSRESRFTKVNRAIERLLGRRLAAPTPSAPRSR